MKTLQHYINKINEGQIVESINRRHVKALIFENGQTREYNVKINLEALTPYKGCDRTFLLQAQLVIGINGTNKVVWGCESNSENGKLVTAFNKWWCDGIKASNKREDQNLEIIKQF